MISYREARNEMEARFATTYQPKGEPKIVQSPTGKYSLKITVYSTKPGCWNYTRGEVFCGTEKVAEVFRNYGDFPYHWVESHPNGHDYLVAEEDYQGQTILELDTGKRRDLEPEYKPHHYTVTNPDGTSETKTIQVYANGFGFCWVTMKASPNKQVLAAHGCVWGGGYDVRLYDFKDPMAFPLPVLDSEYAEAFDGWESDQTLRLSRTFEVRKSDGVPTDSLDEYPADSEVEEKTEMTLWTPECLKEKTL